MANKKRILVSLSNWVYDEYLGKYPNKSDFIQEAVIKLHLEKINKQENLKAKPQNSRTLSP